MAAATPGTDLTELMIDAPPELVWQTASNLQAEMPRWSGTSAPSPSPSATKSAW